MKAWILESKAKMDVAILANMPAYWPTLASAYERVSTPAISLESLVTLLVYRPNKPLSDATVMVAASVHLAGLGMRILDAVHTGIDPDRLRDRLDGFQAVNCAHGFLQVADALLRGCQLPTVQRESLCRLLSASIGHFLAAQDLVLEGHYPSPTSLQTVLELSWGSLFSMATGAGLILQTDSSEKVNLALEIGQSIGLVVHLLNFRQCLLVGPLSSVALHWALLHANTFPHGRLGDLAEIGGAPVEEWDRGRLFGILEEIDVCGALLGEARRVVRVVRGSALGNSVYLDLVGLLEGMVGGDS